MTAWAEAKFNKADGSVGMDGDEFFAALHLAVDAVHQAELGKDTKRVFRALELCIDAAEKLQAALH